MIDTNGPVSETSRGTIAVTNSDATPLRLILEPWADETVIPADGTVQVSYSGPQGGRLEVEVKGRDLILYAWEGAVLTVMSDS